MNKNKRYYKEKTLNAVLIEPDKTIFNKIQLVLEKLHKCDIECSFKVDQDEFDVNENIYKVFIKHGNNYYDGEYTNLSITRQDSIIRIKCTITSLESHFITITKRNKLTYGISKVFGRVAVGNVTYTKK